MAYRAYKGKTPEEKKAEYDFIKANVRIEDYAAMHGYVLRGTGRYRTWIEHDSLVVDTHKNCFYWNSREGTENSRGSVIDFAMRFCHTSMHEALTELSALSGLDELERAKKSPVMVMKEAEKVSKVEEKVEFKLPARDDNVKNVFAYLANTRCIEKNIVSEYIADYRLYQDTRKNCVFVSYDRDKKPVFACLRGTNTHISFKGDVKGSDYSHCFYVNNKKEQLIVTESVIDQMSKRTLMRPFQFKDKEYNYLALGGLGKSEAIFNVLKEQPEIHHIVLALDNDRWGVNAIQHINSKLAEMGWKGTTEIDLPFFTKDWNEELKFLQENGIRYDYYIPEPSDAVRIKTYAEQCQECVRYGTDARLYTRAKKGKELLLMDMPETVPEKLLKEVEWFVSNKKEAVDMPDYEVLETALTFYNTKAREKSIDPKIIRKLGVRTREQDQEMAPKEVEV